MRLVPVLLRHLGCASVLLFCNACVGDVSGEAVGPSARFYYPSRAAVGADGNTLVVVNTNFDQRFVTGWLTYVDVPALVQAGDDPNAAAAAVTQGPRVLGLGGPLVVDAAGRSAWLAHRGAGLMTHFSIGTDAARGGRDLWRCATVDSGPGRGALSNREKKTSCDAAHLFDVRMATAAHQGLADEPERDDYYDPFALVPLADGALAVGFLGTGAVAELALSTTPAVRAVRRGPEGSRLTDLVAAGSALVGAGQRASLQAPAGQSLLLRWAQGADVAAALEPSAAMGSMPQSVERGPEVVRLLASPSDPNRVFLLARRPDVVAVAQLQAPIEGIERAGVVDGVGQAPAFKLRATEVLADQALNELAYLPRATGDLLVASSFVRDTLYFFAESGDGLALVHRIKLGRGRGPAALVPVDVDGRSFLAVTTFFDHGLDLIDVSSANVADFRLHARVSDAQLLPTNRAH